VLQKLGLLVEQRDSGAWLGSTHGIHYQAADSAGKTNGSRCLKRGERQQSERYQRAERQVGSAAHSFPGAIDACPGFANRSCQCTLPYLHQLLSVYYKILLLLDGLVGPPIRRLDLERVNARTQGFQRQKFLHRYLISRRVQDR